uniref:ORF-118 n=1 Tax=Physarum polycephalum TaxID=5791 RepID=Q35595_PHYPO|nr:unassigned reading frame [Physarum polycephalum]AAC15944.1 unassigned reading frame [Physarum polycephalum]BAA06117.1 ORF-118 [Physarum polycephalum]
MINFKLYFYGLNTFDTHEKLQKNLKPIFDDQDNAKAIIFLMKEKTTVYKQLFKGLNNEEATVFLKEYLEYKLHLKNFLNKKNPYYIYEKNQKTLYKDLLAIINNIVTKNHMKYVILPY